MALSTIPTAGLSSDQGVNFRNLIINGDMSIAQRGTSTSSLSSGATFGAVDRFRTYIVSGGTWTMSQDSDVPTGQGFVKSTKLDCTTANASLSAGSLLQFQTPLEGQNLQMLKKGTSNAESVTWSFWVRSAKTGTYICEIRDVDNSRSISKSYTISSADTWEKKTITFDGDTTGTLGNDNGKSFELIWWLVGGTSYTSGTLQTSWGSQTDANRAVGVVNLADSTANNWYITGVQLEVGTSASDFEFLPYDVNLQRCQRYYWKETSSPNAGGQWTAVGGVSATNVGRVMMFLPTPMRTIPTSLGTSGTAGDYKIQYQNTGEICNAVPSFVTANYDRIQFNLSTAAGMTVGYYCGLRYNAAGVGYLEVDVEL